MVNLGWLLPEDFLGGAMELKPELLAHGVRAGGRGSSRMSVEEASMGAIQIASHSMVQSIEENSVRKGFDPRDFALVAEGGAGPAFAANIASRSARRPSSCPRTRASPRRWACSSPTRSTST